MIETIPYESRAWGLLSKEEKQAEQRQWSVRHKAALDRAKTKLQPLIDSSYRQWVKNHFYSLNSNYRTDRYVSGKIPVK